MIARAALRCRSRRRPVPRGPGLVPAPPIPGPGARPAAPAARAAAMSSPPTRSRRCSPPGSAGPSAEALARAGAGWLHLGRGAPRPRRARPQPRAPPGREGHPGPRRAPASSPPSPRCSLSAAPTSLSSSPVGIAGLRGRRASSLPDLGIHAEAKPSPPRLPPRPRRSFLDLVVIALAGGGGVETALADAASVGAGWAFALAAPSARQARLARETPWASPRTPRATSSGSPSLSELAASVGPGRHRRRQGPRLARRQGSVAADPRAGRGRDDRPSRHRAHEPPRRLALRRVPPLLRLPGHRAAS